MQIRTIGEESPVDGWATIDYFHVLCHNGSPLFAPQTASDDFWLNVVNLGMYENNIGQYYEAQLKKYVHLPYPGPPPVAPETSAPAANTSHWQRASSWEWPPEYGEGGSSSSSRWQSDRYGPGHSSDRQWQAQDWWTQPRYDPYHMYH